MTLPPARRLPLLVLAYLGPFAVIPLALAYRARADADVCWHAWQGLLFSTAAMLAAGGLAAMTGLTALSTLAGGITAGIVTWLAWVVALIVQLAALSAGLAGQRMALPLFGSLASRLAARQTARVRTGRPA